MISETSKEKSSSKIMKIERSEVRLKILLNTFHYLTFKKTLINFMIFEANEKRP